MCMYNPHQRWIGLSNLARLFTRQLKKPSLSIGAEPLYWEGSTSFAKATHANLEKQLCDLIKPDDEINITDPALPIQMTVHLKLT